LGDVRAAAAACGLSRQSVYKLRRREPGFAAEWDAALARRHEALEAEFLQHVASHPGLAEVLRRMGVLPGAELAPLDTVNPINPVTTAPGPQYTVKTINRVSTTPAHFTQSSPISS
jgi:hypothetical protein